MNKKRLLIYLVITFIITWVPMFLFLALGGKYDASKADTSLLCTYAMLCPAIATLITRWITKEGIVLVGDNSLRLGISFENKKTRWYICAFLFPICYWLIRDIIWIVLQTKCFDMDMLSKYGFGRIGLIIIPVVGLVTAITISFGALGEEIGWRSYMYPKLEEMFGLKKAILIGGIIWGVWHYPLVAVGHIGTGYMGEPYTGFIVFTIDCIFVGCMTYLLVKKTGSIWPAVFLHAFNNTGADPIIMCLNPDKVNGIFKDGLIVQVINVIGIIIVGIVALKLFDKNETKI